MKLKRQIVSVCLIALAVLVAPLIVIGAFKSGRNDSYDLY